MKKKIIIISLFTLAIVVGFFREWIFMNINEQKRVTYFHHTDSHVSPSFHWLSGFSYGVLNFMKWPLTLLFTFIFAYISSIAIRIWFADKEKVRISWIIYTVVMLIGIFFYIIGFIVGHPYETYDVARFLAGLTETPALMVILFASFLLMKKN